MQSGGALATSAVPAGIVGEVEAQQLYRHPQWLRLLHYDKADGDRQSLIRSPEFFLAEDGATSASAEMLATIAKILAEVSAAPDSPAQSVRCTFPARYMWLMARLPLPERKQECPRLESWAKFEQLESIELMLISGYFGNPASTFGHVLMKINNDSIPLEYSLFDLGINYGALVPQDEPTFTYVLRGLFGGYEAGFTDQDYYRFDLTYSRTEFRDMWEYKLNLDAEQQRFLMYHLWEISGKKFQYFFIKGNCAFRLAELLELVTGEDFVSDVSLWYAPISIFHQLQHIDRQRSPQDPLIGEVTYVPSARRTMKAQLATLDSGELALLSDVIARDEARERVSELPAARRGPFLNVLLEYYHYQLAGMPEEEGGELRKIKDDIVRERLALPAQTRVAAPAIPARRSPADGAAPTQFSVGFGYDDVTGDKILLGYAPFHYDGIGNNGLDYSSLSVLDVLLAFDNDNDLRVESADVFRARKINLDGIGVLGESTRSWNVGGGYRQARNGCGRCGESFLEGRVGRSRAFSSTITGAAMVGASWASQGSSVDVDLALMTGRDHGWASELAATYRDFRGGSKDHWRLRWSLRLSLSQHREIRLNLSDDDVTACSNSARSFFTGSAAMSGRVCGMKTILLVAMDRILPFPDMDRPVIRFHPCSSLSCYVLSVMVTPDTSVVRPGSAVFLRPVQARRDRHRR